jgi:hypothetical protein
MKTSPSSSHIVVPPRPSSYRRLHTSPGNEVLLYRTRDTWTSLDRHVSPSTSPPILCSYFIAAVNWPEYPALSLGTATRSYNPTLIATYVYLSSLVLLHKSSDPVGHANSACTFFAIQWHAINSHCSVRYYDLQYVTTFPKHSHTTKLGMTQISDCNTPTNPMCLVRMLLPYRSS